MKRNARALHLDVTPERLALEASALRAMQAWIMVRVSELVADARGPQLRKAMVMDLLKAEQLRMWGDDLEPTPEARPPVKAPAAQARDPWRPQSALDPGDRYGGRKATIKAGKAKLREILGNAQDLGMKEAARALLEDPPRGYREQTVKDLRALADQQIDLIDATTRRMVRHIMEIGTPGDVESLLQKCYSVSRCQGIATDQVSKGYVRGVAKILRDNGYRYIYARTMSDEKVCGQCMPWDGKPFTLLDFLKRYPRHPRCRCYPSNVMNEYGEQDASLHAKSIMVNWEQAALERHLRIT